MSHFKPFLVLLVTLALLSPALPSAAGDADRVEQQAELDRACETAREKKLVPLRQLLIQTCVDEEEFETRQECENYYADYSGATANRGPLFYDLPACVKAFDYAQSERSSG